MEMTKAELEQLKALLPDVEKDFPSEKETLKEAELSIPSSQVFINRTLMDLLKNHESRLKEKMTVIDSRITNGKYRSRYEISESKVRAEVKKAQKAALEQRSAAIAKAKAQALDELIGQHLDSLQREKEEQQEKETTQLKEKLLSKLFS